MNFSIRGLFLGLALGVFGCSSSDNAATVVTVPNTTDAGYDGGNRLPEAVDMSVSARLNTPRTIQLYGTDPDGNALTYRIVDSVYAGTLEGSGSTFTYTPETDRLGSDSFSFTVNDGTTDAQYPAYVWITVNEADHNESPLVGDSIYWTEPGKDLPIALDTWDGDGDTLTYAISVQPEHGTLSGTGSRYTYSPAAGFVGSDTFRFTVDDGKGAVDGRITVCVSPRPVFRGMTAQERYATMTQLSDKRDQMPTFSTLADMQALEQHARSLPGVAFVGSNESGVFGQYADTVQFMILPDPVMGELTPAPPPAPTPMKTVLPDGNGAVLLSGFGPSSDFPPDPSASLGSWLTDKGYKVDVRGASVADFKISSQPALVHVRTHGGNGYIFDAEGNNAGQIESFWTTTPVADPTTTTYDAEVNSGMLSTMNQKVTLTKSENHYGVTPQFISSNWKLKAGAYVHASSCWLGARPAYDPSSGKPFVPENSALQNAVFGTGARLFAGWTRASEVVVIDEVARFVLDRMLGSNLATPLESPPQRPMGASSIKKDMTAKGIDLNSVAQGKGWTSVFNFLAPKSSGGRYLVDRLAPSITQMKVDTDKDELYIYGDLEAYSVGDDAYRISIAATDYNLKRREGSAFVCDLPADASGDVQLRVEDRKSNRTRLSEWTVKMTYSIVGPGTLKQEFVYTIKVVGDVHQYRDEAGGQPTTHKNLVSMRGQGSKADWSGSGVYQDAKYRVKWSGSGTNQPNTKPSSCDACFSFFGQTTPDTPKQLWWNLFVGMSKTGVSEQISSWDSSKNQWVLTNDRLIPVMFPLDNSGIADTSGKDTGMFALRLPAEIQDDGTLSGNSTGLIENKMVGAGNFTGWKFQHQLKWETATPVGGSEIDKDMPR
jgi:hypothetical protein